VGGWGTVTTPLGAFDAVKQVLVENVTDSMDFYRADQGLWMLGVDVTTSTKPSWLWWTPPHDIPVVRLFDEDNNGTMDRAVWVEEELLGTGVHQPAAAATFTMHPNPATDRVEVAMPGEGEKRYRLMSAEGRVVQEGRVMGARGTIPLQHVAPGTYVLELRDGRRVAQQRLVKQ